MRDDLSLLASAMRPWDCIINLDYVMEPTIMTSECVRVDRQIKDYKESVSFRYADVIKWMGKGFSP